MPKSTLRVGTTEGVRMIVLSLMRKFKEIYNDYDIRGVIGNAEQLWEMLENGELDIAFSGILQMAQERVSACPCICHICKKLNLYNDNKLLVFPIKDLTETNPVYILTNKDKVYVEGTDEFKNLLENAVEDLEVCDI